MERGELALIRRYDAAALFGPRDDLDHRLFHVLHGDDRAVLPGGKKRRFIEKVCKVRAREACRRLGKRFEVHVVSQRLILRVHLQDGFAPAPVGGSHINLPVKAAGTQERRVEDVLAVCCRNDDHARVAAEAVHFDQQLVERLLALVVASAETRAASAADCVNFIDEDDRGGYLFRLLE